MQPPLDSAPPDKESQKARSVSPYSPAAGEGPPALRRLQVSARLLTDLPLPQVLVGRVSPLRAVVAKPNASGCIKSGAQRTDAPYRSPGAATWHCVRRRKRDCAWWLNNSVPEDGHTPPSAGLRAASLLIFPRRNK